MKLCSRYGEALDLHGQGTVPSHRKKCPGFVEGVIKSTEELTDVLRLTRLGVRRCYLLLHQGRGA
jgi:hypothetical protein